MQPRVILGCAGARALACRALAFGALACGALWRCRESNPGPLVLTQSFYGRSPLNAFSVLTLTRTCSQRTHLQLISPDAPTTLHQGKPSSDARFRVEGALGLTDFYRLSSE